MVRELPFRRKVLFEALEPRLLLSADLMPGSTPPVAVNIVASPPVVSVESVVASGAEPLTMHAVGPIEGGVHVADSRSGLLSGQPGDLPVSQSYSVDLAAGQTVSAIASIDNHGLSGFYGVELDLLDPYGYPVASNTAFDGAQLQTVAAPTDGNYTVQLTVLPMGLGAGESGYPAQIGWTLNVAVDAALEAEPWLGGNGNDTTDVAQWLDGGQALPLPPAQRTAVVGRLTPQGDGRADTDLYRIDLSAGESLQAETTLSNAQGFMQLLDSAGNIVAIANRTGATMQWDGPLGIPQFVADSAATYFLKVDLWWDPSRALDPVDYTLVVARNTSLDPDSHSDLGLAASQLAAIQNPPLAPVSAASLDAATIGSTRRFDATVNPGGDPVLIDIAPIADGTQGWSNVSPQVRVLGEFGNELLVLPMPGPFGERFVVLASPGTRISIEITSPTDGQFLLQVQGASGDNPAPLLQPGSFGDGLVGSTTPWQNLVLSETYRADRIGPVTLFDEAGNALGDVQLYPWWSDTGVTVKLPDDLATGNYTLVAEAGAFVDLTGQGTERFEVGFTVDAQRPQLVSPTPSSAVEIPTDQAIALTFDEAMNPNWPEASFFDAEGNPLSLNWDFRWSDDGRTLTIQLTDTLPEGTYELRLPEWNLQDLAGNEYDANTATATVDPLTLRFTTDRDTYVMPALVAREPLGSLVFASAVNAMMSGSTDVDEFEIGLGDNVSFTAVVSAQLGQSSDTLPAVQLVLIDPDGNEVASASTNAAGRALMIPDVTTGAAGLWRLRVSSPDGGTGLYSASVVVGAGVQREGVEVGGDLQPSNGSRANAENLDVTSLGLASGIDRLASVGRFSPGVNPGTGAASADVDFFRFTLDAGQSASIVVAVEGTPTVDNLRLGLFDDSGDLAAESGMLVAAAIASPNADRVILDFTNHGGDPVTLYVGARADSSARYSMVVIRGATFDVGMVDSLPQSLGPTGAVLGELDGSSQGGGGTTSDPGSSASQMVVYDGSGYRWDLYSNGVVNDGSNDAYDGGQYLRLSDALSGLSQYSFSTDSGTLSVDGRTLSLTDTVSSELRLNRKVYVPTDDAFARFLDQVTNTGTTTRTVTLTVYGNLGSDGGTQLFGTDTLPVGVFDITDHWMATDDRDGSGDPSLAHVSWGAGGLAPSSVSLNYDSLTRDWTLTLAPGQTVGLLHYAVQGPNQATAQATAQRLLQLPTEAVTGLSTAEMASVANFALGNSDQYGLWVNAGDHLELSAQAVGQNALPFTLRLTDPDGVVRLDTGLPQGPVSGLSTSLDATVGGQWSLQVYSQQVVGEYLLQVTGATGTPPAPQMVSSTPADAGPVDGLPPYIDVNFDSFIRSDSADAGDLVLDQVAVDAGAEVTGVEVRSGRTLRFHLNGAALPEGIVHWAIADGAVLGHDGQGNAAASGSFNIDLTPPQVTDSNPATQRAPLASIMLTMSEAIDPASVSGADIASFTGPEGQDLRGQITGIVVNDRQLTVNFANQYALGEYRLTIGPDIRDLAGNPLNQDGDGTAGEATDDRFTAAVQVTQIDLVVDSITLPPQLLTGQSAQLSWTVANTGSGPLAADTDWYDRVWLVGPDDSETYIGDYYHYQDSGLAAGDSVTITQSFIVPLGTDLQDGNYRIRVATDIYGYEPELDEGNNALTSPATVALSNVAPDLVVSNIVPPSGVTTGVSFSVQWTDTNQGTATANTSNGYYYDLIQLTDADGNLASTQRWSIYFYDNIPADESRQRSMSITLPAALAGGQYRLRITTDAASLDGSQVNEGASEDNNSTLSDLFTAHSFDLRPASVTAPAAATMGEQITVSWQVQNVGGAAGGGYWYDRVQLVNPTTGEIAYEQNAGYKNHDLSADGSYTDQLSFMVPTTAALAHGDYLVRVLVDVYNYRAESNESNNTLDAASRLTVTPVSVPDLVVSALSSADSVAANQDLSVTWTVANQGDAATTHDYYDRIWLVDGNGIATQLGDVYQPAMLAADATIERTQAFRVPHTLPLGTYRVRVATDIYGYINELLHEDNNTTTGTQTLQVTTAIVPDLQMQAIAPPASITLGQSVTVTWTGVNNGTGVMPANSTWYDRVELLNAGTSQVVYTGSAYVNPVAEVAVGGTYGGSYTFTPPISYPSYLEGNYRFRITSDGSGYQNESNESNNTLLSNDLVPLVAPPTPDLVVAAVTPPGSAPANTRIAVTWQDRNQGDAPSPQTYYTYFELLNNANGVVYNTSLYVSDPATIPVDGAAARSHEFVLPSTLTPGSYRVRLTIDQYYTYTNYQNLVAEYDHENNNVTISSPFTVTEALRADLTNVRLETSLPPAPTFGSTLNLTYAVDNGGVGSTQNVQWNDRVQIVRADNPATVIAYVDVGAGNSTAGVAAGASYSNTVSIALPLQAGLETGDYLVQVLTDVNNNLNESNRGNNNFSTPLHISVPPLANLVVQDLSAPSAATSGLPIDVSWTTANIGDGDLFLRYPGANYFFDRVYLADSAGNVLNDLGAFQVNGLFPAGSTLARVQRVTIPDTVADGSYTIVVKTDGAYYYSNDYVNEHDHENDNTAVSPPITVTQPPRVDLQADRVTTAPSAATGGPLTVNWRTLNAGSADFAGSFNEQVQVSTTADFSANVVTLAPAARFTGSIAAGGAAERSAEVNLPIGINGPSDVSKVWYLRVVTDISGEVYEYNLENNNASTPSSLVLNRPALPDLVVAAVDAPDAALAGGEVVVTYTVTNNGAEVAGARTDRITLVAESGALWSLSADKRIDEPLAVGQSQTLEMRFTLPVHSGNTGFAGRLRAQVITDIGNTVVEYPNDDNNTRSDNNQLTVSLPPLSNLAVTDIFAPVDALTESDIPLRWTVTNRGDAATGSGWTDQLWLSADTTLDGGDRSLGAFSIDASLAAGASLERVQTITLPRDGVGSFHVIVRTDNGNSLFEGTTGEGDNVTVDAQTLTTRQRPLPNLVVASVTPPENAFSGQAAVVGWTVRNIGNGATTVPTWHDAVYLSADDTLDSADTQLAVVENPGYLDVNGAYANSAGFTLPRGIDGNYRFIVVTDIYNQLFEGTTAAAEEHDNTSAVAVARVTLTPPPDLQVTEVTAPPQAFSGEPITITWHGQNNGDGRTRETAWYDRVYLSTDTLLDGTDLMLGDVAHSGALGVGEGYTGSLTTQLPIGLTGSFHFIVATDIHNQVYEHTLETNNTRAEASVTEILLTPPPDLEVVSSHVPDTARAGAAFAVHYRVENLGATDTPARQAWWYDQAWLSLDDNIDGSDLSLGTFAHYGTLATDAGYDAAISGQLPSSLLGRYKVLLRTDVGNAVFEGTGEANNLLLAGAVEVYQSRPDLVVGDFTMPATVEAGRTALFSWTVENRGDGDTILAGWTDSLWASLDDTIGNGDDLLVGNVGHAGVLAPTGSYPVSVAPVVPFALSGAGRFYVRTDGGSQITESNEANNASALVRATILRRESDLQVTEASASPVAGDDRSFDLHFVVRNDGVAGTNVNSWADGIWLSADASIGAGDTRVQTVFRGNPLSAGDSYAVDLRIAVPVGVPAGNFKVLVRADDDNTVVEGANEGNNTAVATVTIGGVPAPDGRLAIGDLVVRHPDLTVVAVDAPESAFSGQQVTVQWTVRNQGPDDAVSPYWWGGAYDQVYLSSDPFLDSGDISLGYVGWGDQARNTDVNRSLVVQLPVGRSGPFYVLVKTDAGNFYAETGAEGNNLGFDPALLDIALAPPADLVAGAITLPANAHPGLAMDVTYTVSNASTNTALGAWRDTLYLSTDDVYDTGDVVFGSVDVYGPVGPNTGYTRTVHATVPGVDPGDYMLIVRSDVRNVLPEANESNNLSASVDAVTLDVPSLTIGVPTIGTWAAGQSLFFKVSVGADEALRFTLDGPGTDLANDMWVSHDSVPSRSRNEVGTGEQFTPDPVLTIPTTVAGVYYVRIDASAFASGAYSLRADLVPFAVERVSKDTVGNRGEVTMRVDGARFDDSTRFELVAADGSVFPSVEVNLKDAGRAYVSFDLYGAAVGTYDLRAVRTDATGAKVQATLAASVQVVAGEGADAFITISGPTAVQVNRDASFYLNYSNDGDTDTMAPLLIVTPGSGTSVGLSSKTLSPDALFILGTSLDGPIDLLRPGAHYSLPVAYKAPGQAGYLSIEARPVQSDSAEQITDWAAIERALRPTGVDFTDWQAFWARVQPAIGGTMGDLVQVLNDMAVRLSPAGDPVRDVRKLFALQLATDPNWMPARAVSGRLLSSDDASTVAGASVQLLQQRGDNYRVVGSATTGADGSFALSGVRPGSYFWALGSGQFDMDRNGAADTSLTPVTVTADAPVNAGDLYLLPSSYASAVVRQDSNAKLLVDDAGVAHMFWTRGDLLYHAYRDSSGLWTDARPISERSGSNLSVAAGATLVAGQPGLMAVWEEGNGNETQIFGAVGVVAATGGYVWSRPLQITQETVGSYSPTVEIDGAGNAVVTFLRRDFAVQDDPDQYYAVLEIDPNALVWSDVAGLSAPPAAQAAFDAAELEPQATTKISVGYPSKDFGPYEIAGFSFKAGFEGTISSTLDDSACTVADSLTGKGSLAFRVPEIGRAVFEGSASGTANWFVDPNTQDWAFSGAQIDAAASGKLEVKDGIFKVLQAIPATAPVALSLRKAMNFVSNYTGGAVRLENAVILGPFGFEAKDLRWSTKSPFPAFVWPDSIGEFSIGGEIGLQAKGVVKSWDAEISLEGRVGLKAKVYPAFQLDANYTVSLQGKVAGWVLVNGEWSDSTTLVSSLEVLSGGAANPSEASDLIFVWDPAATLGTTNVYGNGAVDPNVASNRVGDSSSELARGSDGSVYGLSAHDGDAVAGEIGNRITVKSLANGQWGNATTLSDTLGFNSEGELAVLADGSRLALWSHASADALTISSPIADVMTARKQSDLYFAIDTGAGFTPSTRFTGTPGSESSLTLAEDADGGVVIAWVNDSGSEQVLYTASWNGSGFSAATEVTRSAGGEISAVTIALSGSQTLLAWNLDTDPADPDNALVLQTAVLDHGTVTVGDFQASAMAEAFDKVLAAPVAAASTPQSTSLAPQSGWPVFAVPEDCKKCTPEKLKKITEAAPDCRPGGGSTTTLDSKKCEQKTITYAPCVTRPRDPNDIQGPDGFGDANWVKAGDTFDYTIRFENAADATAPAQVVTVTQTLDADLDPRSFRVGSFGFGDVQVDPTVSRSFYSGRLDLRDSQGIYVDVTVNVDTSSRVVTWTFTTIDPETGDVPADANLGFLPPDVVTGEGQGFVSYTVKANRNTATGAVVDAQARIVFDTEGPIDTPAIFNTLDAGLPSSAVEALPATTDTPTFTVRWSGTDAAGGSAIRDYEVYVSTDGGTFELWQLVTADTEALFEGEGGHRYAFYSVARDNAGNVEAAPATADASIQVLAQTGSVSGVVFNDIDGNGQHDADEGPLSGWTVFIDANADGAREDGEASATTGTDGFWQLLDLQPGLMRIALEPSSGYEITSPAAGYFDLSVAAGDALTDRAFGLLQLGSIAGMEFNDLNGNGQRDNGEAGLSGWTVFIDSSGDGQLQDGERSTLSADDGSYRFDDLRPGTYQVAQVVPEGWIQTRPGASGANADANTSSAVVVTLSGSLASISLPACACGGTVTAVAAQQAGWDEQLVELDKLRADPGYAGVDGSGVRVVVIDTGIDASHPFFDGRVVYQYDFADNDTQATDRNGHGTHVAGVIAGSDPMFGGVAPGTELIVLKVFGDDGSGAFGSLERALQWVVTNGQAWHVGVVNLSLGDGRNWATAGSHYGLGDEFAALAAQNIITVAADGNNYASTNALGVAYPGADPAVLAVGAVWAGDFGGPWRFGNGGIDESTGSDHIASFSQRDPNQTDVFAPGARLTSAAIGGGVRTMQGTSQSAAYVSGVAALAQQMAREHLGRSLSVAEFHDLLASTSVSINDGDDEHDNVANSGLNFPRLDVQRLVGAIMAMSNDAPPPGGGGTDTDTDPGTGPTPVGPAGAGSVTVTVNPGQTVGDIEFGFFKLGRIAGVVFDDLNGNGAQDAGEAGIVGATVYVDANDNGQADPGETTVATSAGGAWQLEQLMPRNLKVAEAPPAGWQRTGAGSHTVTVTSGLDAGQLDFGRFDRPPLAVDDSTQAVANQAITGNVLDNDSDPGRPDKSLLVVSVIDGHGPAHGTLELGADGQFSYTAQAGYEGSDSFRYAVSDGVSRREATVSLTLLHDTLRVAGFNGGHDGFTVVFSRPIAQADLDVGGTAADLVVTNAAGQTVAGSLFVAGDGLSARFIASGGLLADGVYGVRLAAGASAMRDLTGVALDGDGNGMAGDDYLGSFTVARGNAVSVGLADTARGPGQALGLAVNDTGLALRLSNAAGVTAVGFTLAYDPALLGVATLSRGNGLPAAATFAATQVVPGQIVVQITLLGGLPAGAITLAQLVATVPGSASYGAAELLDVRNLQVNGGAMAALDDDAVHVAAFAGDVNRDRSLSAADVSLMRDLLAGTVPRLPAWPLVDGRIIGDANGSGAFDAIDPLRLAQTLAGAVGLVAPVPGAPPITPTPPVVTVPAPPKTIVPNMTPKLTAPTPSWVTPLVTSSATINANTSIRVNL